MKFIVLILLVVSGYLLFSGGDEERKGFESPDAIGKHVVAALNAKDRDAVLDVYVPKAMLEEALDCPGTNPWLTDSTEDIQEVNAILRFGFRRSSRAAEYLKHDVTRIDNFGPGDDVQGCTAKTNITRYLTRMHGRHYFYGTKMESKVGANLIKIGLDGDWWVLKR
jgi:hypothetical protein